MFNLKTGKTNIVVVHILTWQNLNHNDDDNHNNDNNNKSTVQWPAARRSGCAYGKIKVTVRLGYIKQSSQNSTKA